MSARRVPARAAGAGLAVLLAAGCLGAGFLISAELRAQPPAIVSASQRAQALLAVEGTTGTSEGTPSASPRTTVPAAEPSRSPTIDPRGPFRAPARLPFASCTDAKLLTDPDGVVRGVLRCDARLFYAQLDGGRWTTQDLGAGFLPGGLADDGRTTFLLYQTVGDAPDLWLARRTRDGRLTRALVKRDLMTTVSESALVARDGTWWAVWTELDRTGTTLWSAGTLFGPQAATSSRLVGRGPSMVLRGSGVFLAFTGGARAEGNTVYAVTANDKGFGRPSTLSGGAGPAQDAASLPVVAVVGGAVTVAYRLRTERAGLSGVEDLVVATWTPSGWSRRSLEAYAAGVPSLLDAGGRPLVAWTQLVPEAAGGGTWRADRAFGCLAVAGPDGWQTTRLTGTVTAKPALLAAAVTGGRLVTLVREDPSPGLVALQQ